MTAHEPLLGRTVGASISASELDLWTLPSAVDVTYNTSELQALCPATGQPDLYDCTISYSGTCTIESKALKHYLWSFRDVGIGCEELAATLADELTHVLGSSVTVTLAQQTRGGLRLSATCCGELSA